MDTTIVLGHESKIKINNVAFAVRRGRVRVVADEHETGDTESGDFKRQKGGRRQLEAELEFYEDTNIKLHSAPLNLIDGQRIDLKVYDRGLLKEPYSSPNFVLSHVEIGIDVNNPNNGSFAGKSDGAFTVPTD